MIEEDPLHVRLDIHVPQLNDVGGILVHQHHAMQGLGPVAMIMHPNHQNKGLTQGIFKIYCCLISSSYYVSEPLFEPQIFSVSQCRSLSPRDRPDSRERSFPRQESRGRSYSRSPRLDGSRSRSQSPTQPGSRSPSPVRGRSLSRSRSRSKSVGRSRSRSRSPRRSPRHEEEYRSEPNGDRSPSQ